METKTHNGHSPPAWYRETPTYKAERATEEAARVERRKALGEQLAATIAEAEPAITALQANENAAYIALKVAQDAKQKAEAAFRQATGELTVSKLDFAERRDRLVGTLHGDVPEGVNRFLADLSALEQEVRGKSDGTASEIRNEGTSNGAAVSLHLGEIRWIRGQVEALRLDPSVTDWAKKLLILRKVAFAPRAYRQQPWSVRPPAREPEEVRPLAGAPWISEAIAAVGEVKKFFTRGRPAPLRFVPSSLRK